MQQYWELPSNHGVIKENKVRVSSPEKAAPLDIIQEPAFISEGLMVLMPPV